MINNSEYLQMTPRDQNILKWASLLHDICKLGWPRFEGKDHIHPFKGAREVLLMFRLHGIINLDNQAQVQAFNTVVDLLHKSRQDIPQSYA